MYIIAIMSTYTYIYIYNIYIYREREREIRLTASRAALSGPPLRVPPGEGPRPPALRGHAVDPSPLGSHAFDFDFDFGHVLLASSCVSIPTGSQTLQVSHSGQQAQYHNMSQHIMARSS